MKHRLRIGLILSVIVAGSLALLLRHSSSPQSTSPTPNNIGVIRYLALGDSYTIGQSVHTADRWPNQLVSRLGQEGISVQIVGNPSVTGYTTQNLINRELPLLATTKPDFVTLLIGVNDYVQDVPIETFKANFESIVTAIQKRLPTPNRLVIVTIPDYAKTPTGAQFGLPATATIGIEAFNGAIKQIAAVHQAPVVDIFNISQLVTKDADYTAIDGLHPSGKQYALWAQAVLSIINDQKILR